MEAKNDSDSPVMEIFYSNGGIWNAIKQIEIFERKEFRFIMEKIRGFIPED